MIIETELKFWIVPNFGFCNFADVLSFTDFKGFVFFNLLYGF